MKRKLKPEHQVFIVQSLACFMTPSEIVEAVKEEFGVTIKREHVRYYNPEQNPELGAQWKELFERLRRGFLRSTADIGIAHRAYRLCELQNMMLKAKRMGNYALAAQLLEQAAKECGDFYTNRRRFEITDLESKRRRLAALIGMDVEEVSESPSGVN